MSDDVNFSALIASRICHDLISPIGAIGNALELLALSDDASGPEMDLIRDSAENAAARIRFFRTAFGAASAQMMGPEEVSAILRDVSKGGRSDVHWAPTEAVARSEVQLVFLAIQCLETAMPYGAHIRAEQTNGAWQVVGETPKINLDPDLWAHLETPETVPEILPSQVQFVLLTSRCAQAGRRLQMHQSECAITLSF